MIVLNVNPVMMITGSDLYQVALVHRRRHAQASRLNDAFNTLGWLFAQALQDRVIRGALWGAAALLGGLVAGWIVYGSEG